ncbi:aspartate--tRNA ligase dps1 [Entomophthora muscae]|uniref:Aspartate--tRNA ligase dps1 n=1 Tax=Entomophthora muscae TaxID=34485 RepID=A0ACC2UPW1_9FUNG|nr:aspartate--tRNA ligase dps1 [Entomophthora muscae]
MNSNDSSHQVEESKDIKETTQALQDASIDEPTSKKAQKKLEKEREKQKRKEEVAARLAAEKAARESTANDFASDNYGKKPLNQSQERTYQNRKAIDSISAKMAGEPVWVRARVQTSRLAGSKNCFFVLRQSTLTIQGVVSIDEDKVSKHFLKFAGSIPPESIVLVHAQVVKTEEAIKSCTVQDSELKIYKLFTLSESKDRLPFTIEDASRSERFFADKEDTVNPQSTEDEPSPDSSLEKEKKFSRVNLDTRLNNRIVDLRTITNQAIFRIQSGVAQFFREFLLARDFVEIHTPKIIGTASEGGANVFKLNYFKTSAYLAQSPQLYKQMCVCGGFERVFEIAPVFRAEDSNTHRHMTEFMGMDLEMAFEEHYHEVLDLLDELFVHLFTNIKNKLAKQIETVKEQYPFEDFLFLPKTPRLTFPEAVALLRENGIQQGDYDDLSTETERVLGRLVREKYKTDFFMLDKFPLAVRPFYTMPNPGDMNYSNSYDFFMRGEEIMSGAQRIHDPDLLLERANLLGIDASSIQPYIDAFKFGAPPHAGGGIGLERVIMLYLNLGNIRRTSMFPRDPRRLEP